MMIHNEQEAQVVAEVIDAFDRGIARLEALRSAEAHRVRAASIKWRTMLAEWNAAHREPPATREELPGDGTTATEVARG